MFDKVFFFNFLFKKKVFQMNCGFLKNYYDCIIFRKITTSFRNLQILKVQKSVTCVQKLKLVLGFQHKKINVFYKNGKKVF